MTPGGPQMVVGSRMLALGWAPADPGAVGALAPSGMRLHPGRRAVMSQYVVDTAIQTSGIGAHSATLIGIDLGSADPDPSAVPPRIWVGAVASTRTAQEFFAARGIPTGLGSTTVEVRGDAVVGLTAVDEVPAIRVVASVGAPTIVEAGERIFVRPTESGVVEVVQPWIATLASSWSLTSLEFIGPSGVFDRLRPPEHTDAAWGYYSPNASFSDPGVGGASVRPLTAMPAAGRPRG